MAFVVLQTIYVYTCVYICVCVCVFFGAIACPSVRVHINFLRLRISAANDVRITPLPQTRTFISAKRVCVCVHVVHAL